MTQQEKEKLKKKIQGIGKDLPEEWGGVKDRLRAVLSDINVSGGINITLLQLYVLYERQEAKKDILEKVWEIGTTERVKNINWNGDILTEWASKELDNLKVKGNELS